MPYTVDRSVLKRLEPGLPNDNLIMIVKYAYVCHTRPRILSIHPEQRYNTQRASSHLP